MQTKEKAKIQKVVEAVPALAPLVFDFLDFKKFLREFYLYKKSQNTNYSYGLFAQKAKISTRNYLKRIIDGERTLSPELLPRFIQALGLSAAESLYFENLVRFNQATDNLAREHYFELLKQSARDVTSAVHLAHDQFEVLSDWHHIALFEAMTLKNIGKDSKSLSQYFRGRLTPEQVQESIELLLRLGLLTKSGPERRLERTNQEIEYSGEVVNLAIQNFHKRVLTNAIIAIEEDPVEERYLRSLTISLTDSEIAEVRDRIESLFRELNHHYSKSSPNEKTRVVQLNTQVLNLTSEENKPRRPL